VLQALLEGIAEFIGEVFFEGVAYLIVKGLGFAQDVWRVLTAW
jgi:hypothetical protein